MTNWRDPTPGDQQLPDSPKTPTPASSEYAHGYDDEKGHRAPRPWGCVIIALAIIAIAALALWHYWPRRGAAQPVAQRAESAPCPPEGYELVSAAVAKAGRAALTPAPTEEPVPPTPTPKVPSAQQVLTALEVPVPKAGQKMAPAEVAAAFADAAYNLTTGYGQRDILGEEGTELSYERLHDAAVVAGLAKGFRETAISLKQTNPAVFGLVRVFCFQQIGTAEALIRQKEAEFLGLVAQKKIDPQYSGRWPKTFQFGAEYAQEINGRVVMLLVRCELKARNGEAFGLPVWRWACQFVFDGKAVPTGQDRVWLNGLGDKELERISPLYKLFTGGEMPPTPTPRPTVTPTHTPTPRPTVTPTRTPTAKK